jgi:hypothetical protein
MNFFNHLGTLAIVRILVMQNLLLQVCIRQKRGIYTTRSCWPSDVRVDQPLDKIDSNVFPLLHLFQALTLYSLLLIVPSTPSLPIQ